VSFGDSPIDPTESPTDQRFAITGSRMQVVHGAATGATMTGAGIACGAISPGACA
jgi:hypothetical protein